MHFKESTTRVSFGCLPDAALYTTHIYKHVERLKQTVSPNTHTHICKRKPPDTFISFQIATTRGSRKVPTSQF